MTQHKQIQESFERSNLINYYENKEENKNLCKQFCPNYLRVIQLQKQVKKYKLMFEFQQKNYMNNSSRPLLVTRNSMAFQSANFNLCQKCKNPNQSALQIKRQHKKQLIQFSDKLGPKIKEFCKRIQQKQILDNATRTQPNLIIDRDPHFLEYQNKLIVNQSNVSTELPKQLIASTKVNKFISDICVFGLSKKSIQQSVKSKCTEAEPEIIYSLYQLFQTERYNQTSKYLFGNTVHIKKIKKDKLLIDVNLILFQNHKKQSNYIYAFKSDQLSLGELEENQKIILDHVNPERKLFCISIKLNDYTILMQQGDSLSDFNMSVKEETKSNIQMLVQQQSLSERRRRQESKKKQMEAYSSKKVLSIFTFYPFFEFFENLLLLMFNTVKIQKLDIYRSQIEKIHEVDSQFFIKRINEVYRDNIEKFNDQIINFNKEYLYSFSDNKLIINTEQSQIQKIWSSGWIYTILKIFNKDTFYDTLCSVILQDQIVFVCENTHILTYTIYVFSELLLKPFCYPHPCVYIISQQEFLYAPTTIILGLNKNTEWLNENRIIQKYDKTYIHLNESVKITRKKQQKRIRSKRLKQLVNNFYKNYEKGISIFKKKKDEDEYAFNSTPKQKADCIQFIKNINAYFKQEIIDDIPKTEILNSIKQKVLKFPKSQNQDIATEISEQIARQIMKKKKQDPLIQKFIRTQIFLSYLFDKLKLE